MKRIATYSLLLLGCTAANSAPTTIPASRPTTRIATTRLSGDDNPKRALTLYAVAMSTGDPAAVRAAYYAETADERAVVDAYAHLATSVATLRKAATDKFGADGFDNIGFGKMFADQVKAIENTRIFVDGAKALAFTNKDERPDLRLVKIDKAWRISATSFSYPTRQAARLDAQATAYEQLAAEISAGHYRLATDARVAGATKVRDAMNAVEEKFKAAAATHPVTPGRTWPDLRPDRQEQPKPPATQQTQGK